MSTQPSIIVQQTARLILCEPCLKQGQHRAYLRHHNEVPMCGPCIDKTKKTRKTRKLSIAEQIAAPFLKLGAPVPCIACGKEPTPRNRELCKQCARRWRLIRECKSRIRSYEATKDARLLQMIAAMVIRHDLKPEELKKF